MTLTCADNGEIATHLHWSNWTAARATATGTVTWRPCTALCADSRRWSHTSASLTLTSPVTENGKGVLFTRLTLHVTGHTPRGFKRDLAFDEAPTGLAAPQQSGMQATPSAAPSGTLGYAAIEGFWIIAGGPNGSAGSYTDAQVAAAITGAESSYLPGIIQPGVDYCGAGADRAGWGCGRSPAATPSPSMAPTSRSSTPGTTPKQPSTSASKTGRRVQLLRPPTPPGRTRHQPGQPAPRGCEPLCPTQKGNRAHALANTIMDAAWGRVDRRGVWRIGRGLDHSHGHGRVSAPGGEDLWRRPRRGTARQDDLDLRRRR